MSHTHGTPGGGPGGPVSLTLRPLRAVYWGRSARPLPFRGPAGAREGGGSVAGPVIAADGGKPIADAAVSIQLPNGAIVARGTTRADGRYRLPNVAPGTYLIRISAIGFTTREYPGTAVAAGGAATLNAALEVRPAIVEELVTTVSKVPEKRTDAPASAFVITTEEVAERPALSVADHVRSLPQ